MLDSGAFTAWTQGEKINLEDYIRYIKKHKDIIDTYFNLDVIPGKPNKKRTYEMVQKSAARSYDNLQIMKKAGLNPIPVFHQGEDFEWLKKMRHELYIALGGLGGQSDTESIIWLDKCFDMLTTEDGYPTHKVHGLGISSFDLLRRYPWFSCDSTAWAKTSAYGSILVPTYRKGKPDYALNPTKITISDVDRDNGTPPDHYCRMGSMMQERVKDFLTNHVGITIKQVRTNYVERAKAVVYFMKKFEKAIGDVVFKQKGSTFNFTSSGD